MKKLENNLGPGSYFTNQSVSLLKKATSKGVSCFGSKASRFTSNLNKRELATPGPGFY